MAVSPTATHTPPPPTAAALLPASPEHVPVPAHIRPSAADDRRGQVPSVQRLRPASHRIWLACRQAGQVPGLEIQPRRKPDRTDPVLHLRHPHESAHKSQPARSTASQGRSQGDRAGGVVVVVTSSSTSPAGLRPDDTTSAQLPATARRPASPAAGRRCSSTRAPRPAAAAPPSPPRGRHGAAGCGAPAGHGELTSTRRASSPSRSAASAKAARSETGTAVTPPERAARGAHQRAADGMAAEGAAPLCGSSDAPVRYASAATGIPTRLTAGTASTCVVQTANVGHQPAGGSSSWCPELECRTTRTDRPAPTTAARSAIAAAGSFFAAA